MKKVNVTKKEKSVLQGKLTRLAVQIGKAGKTHADFPKDTLADLRITPNIPTFSPVPLVPPLVRQAQ